ncbi:DENN domain-containing protein 5 [Pelomyxa schiedti]|nr:DENN domain-containing protein 5 [Pelomyxa schiedti]
MSTTEGTTTTTSKSSHSHHSHSHNRDKAATAVAAPNPEPTPASSSRSSRHSHNSVGGGGATSASSSSRHRRNTVSCKSPTPADATTAESSPNATANSPPPQSSAPQPNSKGAVMGTSPGVVGVGATNAGGDYGTGTKNSVSKLGAETTVINSSSEQTNVIETTPIAVGGKSNSSCVVAIDSEPVEADSAPSQQTTNTNSSAAAVDGKASSATSKARPQGAEGTPNVPTKPLPPVPVILKSTPSLQSFLPVKKPKHRHQTISVFFVVQPTDLHKELLTSAEKGDTLGDICNVDFSAKLVASYPEAADLPPFLWKFCFPTGLHLHKSAQAPSMHSFSIPDRYGGRIYITHITHFEVLSKETLNSLWQVFSRHPDLPLPEDELNIYAPRCLGLWASEPLFTFQQKWLRMMYNALYIQQWRIPLELFLNNLAKIPVVVPGQCVHVCFSPPLLEPPADDSHNLPSESTLDISAVHVPPEGGLPIIDVSVELLFQSLGVDVVLNIFKSLLLEERVVLCSAHSQLLNTACTVLTSLLYPFTWHHPLIPLVPNSIVSIFNTPSPFLLGIPKNMLHKCFIPADVVLIDLDTATTRFPQQLPAFPEPENSMLQEELKRVVQPDVVMCDTITVDPWEPSSSSISGPANISSAHLFATAVRTCFLRFFVSILRFYKSAIEFIRVFEKPVITFSTSIFINLRPDCKAFFECLCNTHNFYSFLEHQNANPENAFTDLLSADLSTASFSESLSLLISDFESERHTTSAMFDGFPNIKLKKKRHGVTLLPLHIEMLELVPMTLPETESYKCHHHKTTSAAARGSQEAVIAVSSEQQLTASQLGMIKNLTDALFTANTEAIDQGEITHLEEIFKQPQGRQAFAIQLLGQQHSTKPPGRLCDKSYSLLVDLIQTNFRETTSSQKGYRGDGAEEFVYARVRNLDMWQNVRFWEHYFLQKASSLCRSLYGDITTEQNNWKTKSPPQKVSLINKEQDQLVNILCDITFKMTNLAVAAVIMRRFISKMCVLSRLDPEHTAILDKLSQNMTKMDLNDDSIDAITALQKESLYKTSEEKFESDSIEVGWSQLDDNRKQREWVVAMWKSFEGGPTNVPAAVKSTQKYSSFASNMRFATHSVQSTKERNCGIVHNIEGHHAPVLAICHDNMDTFATASCDSTIKLWDCASHTCKGTLSDHTGWVNCLEWDVLNSRIISGSYDKTIKVWDPSRLHKLRSLRGHKSSISCISIYEPHNLIVSGSYDNHVVLWDQRIKNSITKLSTHSGAITCVLCDCEHIISGSRDTDIRVWNLKKASEQAVLKGHKDWIKCMASNANNNPKHLSPSTRILTGSYDGGIKQWDLEANRSSTYDYHHGPVNDIYWNVKEEKAFSVASDSTLKIWSTSATASVCGSAPVSLDSGHSDEITHIAPLMGRFVVTGGGDGHAVVWGRDPNIPNIIKTTTMSSFIQRNSLETPKGSSSRITALRVLDNKILCANWDHSLRVWEFDATLH